MSISLLISGDNIAESEWKTVPIATEEVLKVLVARKRQAALQYIPLLEVGLEIDSSTSNDFLNELKLLRLGFSEKPFDNYERIIERLDYLIINLPNFIKKYNKVFIG